MDKNKLAKAVVAILLAIPLLTIIYYVAVATIIIPSSHYGDWVDSLPDAFDPILIMVSTVSICVLIFMFFFPRILKK